MRLWTLHPKYLDARGLVALWREALLAHAVLRGRTTGYRHHPQLVRFRDRPSALGAIAEYLRVVHAESMTRHYNFAVRHVSRALNHGLIPVTEGQMRHEWNHLMAKLARRDPEWQMRLNDVHHPEAHPLFQIVPGDIEAWERI